MRMKDLKISTKLTLMILAAVISLALFGAIGYSIVNTVKVTGPIYGTIVSTKDLDGDLMPPNLYLVEARMDLLSMMESATDATQAQANLDQLKGNEQAFQDTHDKWNRQLPEGRIKEMLNGPTYTEGKEWIRIVDSVLLPALQRRDERATRDGIMAARPHFVAHKKAVYEMDRALQEMVSQQEAAARSTIHVRMLALAGVGLAGLVVIVSFGLFISRMVIGSLSKTVTVLQSAARGDLRARVDLDAKDESGMMAQTLNETLEQISETVREIDDTATQLAGASEEFSAVSQQISANSEETSAQANVVVAATDQVNRGLQTVAASTEQMSATIKEIAKSATEAARVADGAMRTAAETNAIVAKLGESSAEIGQVIKVITSIAQKTDLLALNATVEAARAGEAGAGFAVVANEVKELAKQTATATEDISRKIEAIQSDAKGAVTAIQSISEVIGQVNNISGTIATAVEEQSATTSEMSRNISEAARGAGEVAQNIQGVAQAAQSTSHGATDSQKAAAGLAEMSTHLRELVGRFRLDDQRNAPPRKKVERGTVPQKKYAEESAELVAR